MTKVLRSGTPPPRHGAPEAVRGLAGKGSVPHNGWARPFL